MSKDSKNVISMGKAYVKPEEKVLDPEKLDVSSLKRLPSPSGWRLLILPYRGTRTKLNSLLGLGARNRIGLFLGDMRVLVLK